MLEGAVIKWGDHVMVIPNGGSVRIGDGPAISTQVTDEAYTVRVEGVLQWMDAPYPHPVPILDTPYEAYALPEWTPNVFAIRLRRER